MSEELFAGPMRRLSETLIGRPRETVLKEARPRLAGYENIVGIAIEEKVMRGRFTGQLCLKVYVREKLPDSSVLYESRVPKTFEGIATDVEAIGEIFAQEDRGCYDSPLGGCSIGHINISAGTFGCLVQDRVGRQYILSNAHVFAGRDAKRGDPIVQPGPSDGGLHYSTYHPGSSCASLDKCIATLTDFELIDFTGRPNRIDAAIAEPISGGRKVDPHIIGIGRVYETTGAARCTKVRKRGRTTELTTGHITSSYANIVVNYRPGYARFDGQIVIRGTPPPFSAGGDSGSLIVDANNRAVGLLFAGNENVTFANPIDWVLQRFGATIV